MSRSLVCLSGVIVVVSLVSIASCLPLVVPMNQHEMSQSRSIEEDKVKDYSSFSPYYHQFSLGGPLPFHNHGRFFQPQQHALEGSAPMDLSSSIHMQQLMAQQQQQQDISFNPNIHNSVKADYEAYLLKTKECQTIRTWCCGRTTTIKATCGGTQQCKITFKSVKEYKYTLSNGKFTDISAMYWLIPVTVCNVGPSGVVFVTTY